MHCIDFWLAILVYPREAKIFEKKLICTAWDLCGDQLKHCLTGFSGTNDTKNILPLPISQNDLEELQQTNKTLLETLLHPVNEAYCALTANASGKDILIALVAINIPALFDAGALMLEFNNEQMAREWLRLASTKNYDAAVYFDSKDVLQTVDRNGFIVEYDCSVYRDNLSRCLVYVDDAHIRGTDLKFPNKWKGVVTLSGDITRDKTVQACMRMRQLGKGHAIALWASHEADVRIKKVCEMAPDDYPTNKNVIKFICENSKRFELDNTPYWVSAAYNYTKKIAAHKLHENCTGAGAWSGLVEKCIDDEFVTLKDMYGSREESQLQHVSHQKFTDLWNLYDGRDDIVEFIKKIEADVSNKLKPHNKMRFANGLDEEQEKELEYEYEQEEQIERPVPMKPIKPIFIENLHNLFVNGCDTIFGMLRTNKVIIPIKDGLSNTGFYQPYMDQDDAWSENLFVTIDFIRVLDTNSRSCDEFLRPVWWIASVQTGFGTNWIVLSSYECNRLLPTFKESFKSTLFMYRPRTSKFHDNHLHDPRLQVTGMAQPLSFDLKLEIQIGIFGGSMYFRSEDEQNAFCGFLGLIPRPRHKHFEAEFNAGTIKPNGFVPPENRKKSPLIALWVGYCGFSKDPGDLVKKLIQAHHEHLRKESHVASIVERGVKMEIPFLSQIIEEEPDDPMEGSNAIQNSRFRKRKTGVGLPPPTPSYWKRIAIKEEEI